MIMKDFNKSFFEQLTNLVNNGHLYDMTNNFRLIISIPWTEHIIKLILSTSTLYIDLHDIKLLAKYDVHSIFYLLYDMASDSDHNS